MIHLFTSSRAHPVDGYARYRKSVSNLMQTALLVAGLLALPSHAQQVYTTATCNEGNSWHWQCLSDDVWQAPTADYEFVAICTQPNNATCTSPTSGRYWRAKAALQPTDMVLYCPGIADANAGTLRNACGSATVLKPASEVFGAQPEPEPDPEPEPEPPPASAVTLVAATQSHASGVADLVMRYMWQFTGATGCRYHAAWDPPATEVSTMAALRTYAEGGALVDCTAERDQVWQANVDQAVVALADDGTGWVAQRFSVPAWEPGAPACYPSVLGFSGGQFPKLATTDDGFCLAWTCGDGGYAATCGVWSEIPSTLNDILQGGKDSVDAEWKARHTGPMTLEQLDIIRGLLGGE